jgi:hypothetical protein
MAKYPHIIIQAMELIDIYNELLSLREENKELREYRKRKGRGANPLPNLGLQK